MVTKPKSLEEGCLLTLRYFGIFSYPLTLQEIHRFNPFQATVDETRDTLAHLAGTGSVFQAGPYFLPENREEWARTREQGNARADRLLGKSGKYVSVIASFPFVRGIAISGSLSKHFASENPDIDYFIITETNRLWIARTLLHLFKKFTFVTGHQHYFCMNYFIDTHALRITHPNLYSAIEVVTLMPVYHAEIFKKFFSENTWTQEFLPNHPGSGEWDYLSKEKKQRLKKWAEGFIGLFFPEKMNHFLMKLTDRKWRRKWKRRGYPDTDYDQAFMTTPHISKNHPEDYEKRVMRILKQTHSSED